MKVTLVYENATKGIVDISKAISIQALLDIQNVYYKDFISSVEKFVEESEAIVVPYLYSYESEWTDKEFFHLLPDLFLSVNKSYGKVLALITLETEFLDALEKVREKYILINSAIKGILEGIVNPHNTYLLFKSPIPFGKGIKDPILYSLLKEKKLSLDSNYVSLILLDDLLKRVFNVVRMMYKEGHSSKCIYKILPPYVIHYERVVKAVEVVEKGYYEVLAWERKEKEVRMGVEEKEMEVLNVVPFEEAIIWGWVEHR